MRELRQEKKLSQGDIEERTGLLRCYVSRVENGHTVPSVETLEKFARALEVPMFYEGENPPELPKLTKPSDERLWGSSGKDERFVKKLRRLLGKSNDESRKSQTHHAHGAENGSSIGSP